MMTTEQIVGLARKLIELGIVPDNDDCYNEFEEIIIDLHDALKSSEGIE